MTIRFKRKDNKLFVHSKGNDRQLTIQLTTTDFLQYPAARAEMNS